MSANAARELPQRQGTAVEGEALTSVRKFRVRTTSHSDDEAVVLTAANLPARRSEHPNRPGLFLHGKQITEETRFPGGGSNWLVTCEYEQPGFSNTLRTRCTDEEITDPLQQPIVISWDSVETQEAVRRAFYIGTVDREGNEVNVNNEPTKGELSALLNSANQPNIEPLLKDVSRLTATITGNIAEFDPTAMMALYDAPLNADAFSIRNKTVDVGQARVRRITATEAYYGTCVLYYQFSLTIEFKKDGWFDDLRDEGFAALNADGDDVIELQDENGQRISEPQFLDGSGAALAPDDFENIRYRRWLAHLSSDFSNLPIPTS